MARAARPRRLVPRRAPAVPRADRRVGAGLARGVGGRPRRRGVRGRPQRRDLARRPERRAGDAAGGGDLQRERAGAGARDARGRGAGA
ncbi:MAG: hypothetical protein ACK56I_00460, partial [bacterium]